MVHLTCMLANPRYLQSYNHLSWPSPGAQCPCLLMSEETRVSNVPPSDAFFTRRLLLGTIGSITLARIGPNEERVLPKRPPSHANVWNALTGLTFVPVGHFTPSGFHTLQIPASHIRMPFAWLRHRKKTRSLFSFYSLCDHHAYSTCEE